MNREDYLIELKGVFEECAGIAGFKNLDYAKTGDAFANFLSSSAISGVSVERGILTRIVDKISRIGNLLDQSPAVSDEKIEDTILDAINYLAILKVYRASNEDREGNVKKYKYTNAGAYTNAGGASITTAF